MRTLSLKKSRRVILVVASDTHGGFKLGLMNPDVELLYEDEKGNLKPWNPTPTASQERLWTLWTNHIQSIKELAGRDEIILLHNGDLCHGNKYPSLLVSTRMADQILIGEANLRPWFKLPNLKSVRVVVGTEAHNFGEGSAEMLITRMLGGDYKTHDIRAYYHAKPNINGIEVDTAHHGPYTGSREWLKGNVARFYLRDLMWRDIEHGKAPPGLVLRAHYHQFVHEYLEMANFVSRLVVTPSYCMLGDHAYQAARSPDRVTNGLVAFEIVDGRIVEMHKLFDSVDLRAEEIL